MLHTPHRSYSKFTRDTPRGRPASEKATAVLLCTLGLSFNAIARIHGVAASTVMRWVRASAEKTYEKPEPGQAVVVELEEMWHYLHAKKQALIWKAYCRDTGQLIDRECGNRDQAIFAELMEWLRRWSAWFFCADEWAVYPMEIPDSDLIRGKRGTVALEEQCPPTALVCPV